MRFLMFAAATAIAAQAAALDLYVNGIRLNSYSSSGLAAISYAVPGPDGSAAKGVSLGELFPLVAEAWALEVSTVSSSMEWKSDDLGERLFNLFLTDSGGGRWDVEIDGKSARNLTRIDLSADLLEEDGLEFWISWEGIKELKEETAKFASAHGKTIRVVEVPNTQTKLLALARAGGKLPDLAMVQSDYVPSLAAAATIQAVDYLVTEDLLPKGFESFGDAGRFWAVPLYFDAQLVFYRPSVVGASLPLSYTLEELEAKARKLKGKIDAPLCWNAYSAYWLLPFMAAFGEREILDSKGGMPLEDGPAALALERILSLKNEGLLKPLERDAMTSWFVAGKAGFILSASYDIPQFESLGIDFSVAPFPIVASTGKPVAPLLDFKGLAVCRRTEKPTLARRLIQFLTAPGFQARFTSKLSKLPASRTAMALSKGSNKYFEQLSRGYEIGLAVPPAKSYGIFKNVMWKLLRFFLGGQMNAKDTLSTAARLMEENMKEE